MQDGWCWLSMLWYDQKSLIRTELIEYQFTTGLKAYMFQAALFPVRAAIYCSSDLLGKRYV